MPARTKLSSKPNDAPTTSKKNSDGAPRPPCLTSIRSTLTRRRPRFRAACWILRLIRPGAQTMPLDDEVSAVRDNHRFDQASLERYLGARMQDFRGPLSVR